MKNIIITFCLIGCTLLAKAQTGLRIGQQMPNYTFNDVQHASNKKLSVTDFKGKWLIINCWNRASLSTRNTFQFKNIVGNEYLPKEDKLQSKYGDKVQFLVVGYAGARLSPHYGPAEADLKQDYEKLRSKDNLKLPFVCDSVFFDRFDVLTCPYTLVIDPKGVIRGITLPLEEKDLVAFLKGKTPDVPRAYSTHEPGSQYLFFKNATYPEIGKPFPNFTFNDVHYFDRQILATDGFKGKWLIIDCWSQFCASCVASMPRMDTLQNVLSSKVKVLLLGWVGQAVSGGYPEKQRELQTKKLYEHIRGKSKLSLTVAYDSTFFTKADLDGVPHIFVIDPDGILRAVTWHLTLNDMQAFLEGKTPDLPKSYRIHEPGNPRRYTDVPSAVLETVWDTSDKQYGLTGKSLLKINR
jgi:thiol-disulfide isomerase/thioredoxin